MKKIKDRKALVIVVLLIISLIMVVGFAAFNSNLIINGTASTNPNWCIGFDNTKTNTYEVTKGVVTGTSPTGTMTYGGTSCSSTYQPVANLGAVFYQPGDKIEYTLTIANKGSIGAVIESITVDGNSVTSNQTITKGNIIWKVYMPESTTLSAATGTTTMVVSAEFQNTTDLSSYTAQESQTITVGINTIQDDGSNAMEISQKVYAVNTNKLYKNISTLQNIGQTYESCVATGKNICLRYTIENNAITGVELCFMRTGIEYCMKGWINESSLGTKPVYNSNIEVLNTAFTGTNACSGGNYYFCRESTYGPYYGARNDGYLDAYDGISWHCYASVSDDYNAYCT
ncbi:MAG: hypothetical protein IKG27_02720 [Bacilli bacterium]|nr:hypothetical protein [Bacilli bacterium]